MGGIPEEFSHIPDGDVDAAQLSPFCIFGDSRYAQIECSRCISEAGIADFCRDGNGVADLQVKLPGGSAEDEGISCSAEPGVVTGNEDKIIAQPGFFPKSTP